MGPAKNYPFWRDACAVAAGDRFGRDGVSTTELAAEAFFLNLRSGPKDLLRRLETLVAQSI